MYNLLYTVSACLCFEEEEVTALMSCNLGTIKNAGVENAARSQRQGWKMQ